MNNDLIHKIIKCPGCGGNFVLDKLKNHIRSKHGFTQPFSLSEAVFMLSRGRITVSDLYSEHSYIEEKIKYPKIINQYKSKKLDNSNKKSKEKLEKKKTTPIIKNTSRKRKSNDKYIICILCGEKVSAGKLLEHKRKIHKENESTPKLGLGYQASNQWVPIFSGGLPGLGKNSR